MKDKMSREANQGETRLKTVWQLLTEDDQREFWKYAGQHARKLSHRSNIFKKLCAALKDAESGRSGVRPINAIVGAVRPLSSDDLQRGVGRFKSRLLDQPNAQPFLIVAFCNWIQDCHRAALNAVLDAMGCSHDERGSLKGSVPAFSPEVALQEIGALVSVHNAHSLAIVCGGLMLNDMTWDSLAATIEMLREIKSPIACDTPVAQHSPIEPPHSDDASTFDPLKSYPITIMALKSIREGLDLLGQHIAAALAEVTAYRVPDLTSTIECWDSVRRQHSEAERALGVSSASIGDLEAALSHQSEVARAASDLTRCRSIVHSADPNFAGCAVIREKCDALERIVESRQTLDPASMSALAALLQLVEYGDEVDDEHATRLQIEIEGVFGKQVTTAVLRGKLTFETSPPCPSEGSSESMSPMITVCAQNEERNSGTNSPTVTRVELTSNVTEAEPETEGMAVAETKPVDCTAQILPNAHGCWYHP